MKILITGYSGFVGSNLIKFFSGKYTIIKLNLRNIPNPDHKDFEKFLDNFLNVDVIINCAASLNPKSKRDLFINEDFPSILNNFLKKKQSNTQFIHLSTLNVIIDNRKDIYTISKKNAEEKLKDKQVVILRLPLVYEKINKIIQNSGNLKQIENYLNINFLPIYPMVYPGHFHMPVDIKDLIFFIEKIFINNGGDFLTYNIVGKDKKSLWDIFNEMAINKGKKVFKLNTLLLNKLMPNFIKKYLRKKVGLFQQFVIIDNTEFNEKKTYL